MTPQVMMGVAMAVLVGVVLVELAYLAFAVGREKWKKRSPKPRPEIEAWLAEERAHDDGYWAAYAMTLPMRERYEVAERWMRSNVEDRRKPCPCGRPGTAENWYGPYLAMTCEEHRGVGHWSHDNERCLSHDANAGSCIMRPGVRGVDIHVYNEMVDGTRVEVTDENEHLMRHNAARHGWEWVD